MFFGAANTFASTALALILTLLVLVVLVVGQSVDGTGSIVYVSDQDGTRNLYLQDLDSGITRRLTDSDAADLRPTFSPDGRHITFYSNRDGVWNIYMMHSSGLGLRRLVDSPDRDGDPVFSPDGRWLAYDSTAGGSLDIYVLDATCIEALDVCDALRLTTDAARDQYPAFSPDGRWLAFESNRDGHMDVYVLDTSCFPQPHTCEDTIHPLTVESYSDWGCVWSPDGSQLMFAASSDNYWQLKILPTVCQLQAGGCTADDIPPLVEHHADCGQPSWSRDGRFIVYEAWIENNWELFVVDAGCVDPLRDCDAPVRLTATTHNERSAVWWP